MFQLKMYLTQGEVLVLWVIFVMSCVMKPLSTEPAVFRQSMKIKISPDFNPLNGSLTLIQKPVS